MKNKIILTTYLFITNPIFAQVGINNINPKTTLDVGAVSTDDSKLEGSETLEIFLKTKTNLV